MERDYTCIACVGKFKVVNEIPRPETPEVAIDVVCPFCETKNRITWPSSTSFMVVSK